MQVFSYQTVASFLWKRSIFCLQTFPFFIFAIDYTVFFLEQNAKDQTKLDSNVGDFAALREQPVKEIRVKRDAYGSSGSGMLFFTLMNKSKDCLGVDGESASMFDVKALNIQIWSIWKIYLFNIANLNVSKTRA